MALDDMDMEGVNVEGVEAPTAELVQSWSDETDYSEKYCDDVFEYRRVTVSRAMLPFFPQGRCMTDDE